MIKTRKQADKACKDFFKKLKDYDGWLPMLKVEDLAELKEAIDILAELAWMYEELE